MDKKDFFIGDMKGVLMYCARQSRELREPLTVTKEDAAQARAYEDVASRISEALGKFSRA